MIPIDVLRLLADDWRRAADDCPREMMAEAFRHHAKELDDVADFYDVAVDVAGGSGVTDTPRASR